MFLIWNDYIFRIIIDLKSALKFYYSAHGNSNCIFRDIDQMSQKINGLITNPTTVTTTHK